MLLRLFLESINMYCVTDEFHMKNLVGCTELSDRMHPYFHDG